MLMNGNVRGYAGYGRLGRFAGSGPGIFPGGPTFFGAKEQGVFWGSDTGFIGGAKNQGYTWDPPPLSLKDKAGEKWVELSDADASEADMKFKDRMKRRLETLLQSYFEALGAHSIMGYTGDATQNIISIGNQLKQALKDLVAYQMQPEIQVVTGGPTAESNAALQAQLDAAKQQAKLQKELSEQRAAAAATPAPEPAVHPYSPPASNMSPIVGTSSDEQPAWVLPAAIAGGLIVVGGLIFALTRKKSAPTPGMAGYRRRRRIRR